MTSRHFVLAFVALAVLVACTGGPAGTAAPTASTTATSSGALAAPTDAAATPTGAGSTATPGPTEDNVSDTPAPASSTPTTAPPSSGPVDISAAIPTEVGGITLEQQDVPIDDFLIAYEEFGPLLTALGKSPEDVEIIQAQGSNAGELMIAQAFRVAGADAAALMTGIQEIFGSPGEPIAPITIADRQLVVQGNPDTAAQYKTYYYGVGDTIFRLAYNGDNFDEQMAALVSQLP